MNVSQGDFIQTTAGEIGRVERVNVVNSVPFYRVRLCIRTAWGIVATGQTALINAGDILKHKAANAAVATSAA